MVNNTTTSSNRKHLNTNKQTKTTTYGVGNQGPTLRQTQKCGGVKPHNGIVTPSAIIRSPTIQI